MEFNRCIIFKDDQINHQDYNKVYRGETALRYYKC